MSLTNSTILHDPVGYGYRHAVVAGDLAFIAGQYASDQTGQVACADFEGQVRRSFANLAAALATLGLDHHQVVRLGTYIVDHDGEKLTVLVNQIREIWGDQPPAQTLTGVARLALPGMLFEVDAVALRPAGTGPAS